MEGMMLHCGSEEASILDLKNVILPEHHEKFKDKSAKYGTVSHDRLVTSIKGMAEHAFGQGCVVKEEYALSGGKAYPGARFFGLMRFDFGNTEVDKALVEGITPMMVLEATGPDDPAILQALSTEDQNVFIGMENVEARMNFLQSKGIQQGEDGLLYRRSEDTITVSEDSIFPALAIRNSYDRSMSVGAAVGYNVFICDNLCLSGEMAFSRKHTVNAFNDVALTMWGLLQSMKSQHDFDKAWRAAAKGIEITQREGFEILGYLAGQGLLPLDGGNRSQFARAIAQWKQPTHEVFTDRTLWSLENAVTFAQRSARMQKRIEISNGVARQFRVIADPDEDSWNVRADEISREGKACNKATILDLLDVIAGSKKREEEAVEKIESQAADIANM